jgi:hypothetical protein
MWLSSCNAVTRPHAGQADRLGAVPRQEQQLAAGQQRVALAEQAAVVARPEQLTPQIARVAEGAVGPGRHQQVVDRDLAKPQQHRLERGVDLEPGQLAGQRAGRLTEELVAIGAEAGVVVPVAARPATAGRLQAGGGLVRVLQPPGDRADEVEHRHRTEQRGQTVHVQGIVRHGHSS